MVIASPYPRSLLGLGTEWLIPRMRVGSRLVDSERKAKYRADGEWKYYAESGAYDILTAREVIT